MDGCVILEVGPISVPMALLGITDSESSLCFYSVSHSET